MRIGGKLRLFAALLALVLIFGCAGGQTPSSIIYLVEPDTEWRVKEYSANVQHQATGIFLSIAPFPETGNGDDNSFFVHLVSFHRPGQHVEINLSKINLLYEGKSFPAEGLACEGSQLKPSLSTKLYQYRSETRCAFIRFQVITPTIDSEFTIDIEDIKINGEQLKGLKASFRRGVVRFRGGFT